MPPKTELTDMSVANTLRRLLGRTRRKHRAPRCVSVEVRSEAEVRKVAQELAGPAYLEPAALEALIRELVALNTPALFLNVVQRGGPLRVVLKPWDGHSVRFRGRNYMVDAGADAPEAVTRPPGTQVTALFPTTPDHPLYVVSIEHQGSLVHTGEFPSHITYLTLVMNGVVTARCERLLQERGVQVFWSDMVA
jgi:hypothetical protein